MSLPEINANLDKWKAEKLAGAYATAQVIGAEAEKVARRTATWHDQSGDARKLLRNKVEKEDTNIYIALAHDVDYGVYLELANDKKYAILVPTLNRFRSKVWKSIKRIMES